MGIKFYVEYSLKKPINNMQKHVIKNINRDL